MKDAEKARKLLDVISVVASNVVEKRLDNVVQTKLAYVTSITYNTNGNAIYRVRLSSSNSDEFECPKLCINELSVGDYVWLNYIGDITNAYIAMPVEPSPAQDVIRNTVAYNLLDNSDFTNPVNQRGQPSYSGAAYGIDRWCGNGSACGIVINEGYITLKTSATSSALFQRLPSGLIKEGEKYTIALKARGGGVVVASCAAYAGAAQTAFVADESGETARATFGYNTSDARYRVSISTSSTTGVDLEWVALYEGEYTAATLPKYMPKGYAAELAECYPYQVYFDTAKGAPIVGTALATSAGAVMCFVPTPQKLRINPAISYTKLALYGQGYYFSDAIEITGITNIVATTTGVRFTATSASAITQNAFYQLVLKSGGSLLLDSNM